ncbi:GTPase IMAP family member 8-like, partial [Clarias magur]
SESVSKLNLVLCGSDDALKASISDLLLRQRGQRAESSAVCVIRKGDMWGHLITLVEMPALYNPDLTEQEVMHQTLHCVSVCDPGVDAFLIIIPEGPFTDEDKAEMQMIQRLFSSRVNEHTMFIINQQSQREQSDETLQSVIKTCGGRSEFYISRTTAAELITCVKDLTEENRNRLYTMDMYCDAQ